MIKTKRLKEFNRTWRHKPERNVPLYYISKNSVSEEQLNEYFDWVLHWCNKKFGAAKSKPCPELEWMWNDRWYQKKNLLGEYDRQDNLIQIRVQGHRTIYNLTNTIIHEYVHYLQPTKGNWYERYHKMWGYRKNPYEIEAFYLGELYAVECALEVMGWMGMR